jgi:hypothetical protein
MIDFPASPTVGQLFVASNGVTYQWNGTTWVTNSAGGTGQVEAGGGTATNLNGINPINTFTLISGNAGGWLNLGSGVYTPPPGKYFIQCTFAFQAPTGGNGTWGLLPYKNGVAIPGTGANGSGSAQFAIPITCGVYVDANGTDTFQFMANVQAASGLMAPQGGSFTAFPLTGLQGPPGPLGQASGDFCAVGTPPLAVTSYATVIPTVILSGNATNSYNPSTGRYTPPQGRYCVYATLSGVASAASHIQLQIRKNGVAFDQGASTTGSNAWYAQPTVIVNVDANGTDWFDVQALSSSGGQSIFGMSFGAFSLNGGPPGPPGPAGPVGTPPVGDFATAGSPALGTTAQVMIMPVVNGNSGSTFNPANGRWTPPAGRYNLYGAVGAYNNTTGINTNVSLRKNGVGIIGTNAATPVNQWNIATVETQVDANGTDYFDLWGSTSVGATASQGYFGGYPLNGIAGQAGAFGTGFRTISNQTNGAAQPSIDVQLLPTDINQLQINFDLTPTVSDVDCILQFYDASGVLDVAGHYFWGNVLGWSTAGAGGAAQTTSSSSTGYVSGILINWSASGGRVSNAVGTSINGSFRIRNIRETTKQKGVNYDCEYQAGNNAYISAVTGGGVRQVTGAITGFRLSFGSGANIAAGGNVTVWGSP